MMKMDSHNKYLRALGARILSEANDLKRTTEALAAELDLDLDLVKAVIAGQADETAAHDILHAMVQHYPVSLADIWMEPDDTDDGVRIVTADQSETSKRVFERMGRDGNLTPYYEYRDSAMSSTAPFKPEWIKELRVVGDRDPYNRDVAYNHGHLMHQITFFIGPVNFYWDIDGERHCTELNTGDSNYITPFVPHSFTSRDSSNLGLIMAVTYGGEVRRSLSDFARIDAESMDGLVADPRNADQAFVELLARHAAAETLTKNQLVERLIGSGIKESRANTLINEGGASFEEISAIADVMLIRPQDLMVPSLTVSEEVVVQRGAQTSPRCYPNDNRPAYEMIELARTRHQPYLKGFDLSILGSSEGNMRHSLHEYIYNYGEVPVNLLWGKNRIVQLAPGDSAYVRPMTEHRFDLVENSRKGNLLMIRIPGGLNGSVVSEFSAFSAQGRRRVFEETQQWF